MLMEWIGGLLSMALGSPEGFMTTLAMVWGASYLRKAATVGAVLNISAYYVGLLAVMSLLGIVDIHPGAVMALLEAATSAVPFA